MKVNSRELLSTSMGDGGGSEYGSLEEDEESHSRHLSTIPFSLALGLRKLSEHPASIVDTGTDRVYFLLVHVLMISLSLLHSHLLHS